MPRIVYDNADDAARANRQRAANRNRRQQGRPQPQDRRDFGDDDQFREIQPNIDFYTIASFDEAISKARSSPYMDARKILKKKLTYIILAASYRRKTNLHLLTPSCSSRGFHTVIKRLVNFLFEKNPELRGVAPWDNAREEKEVITPYKGNFYLLF